MADRCIKLHVLSYIGCKVAKVIAVKTKVSEKNFEYDELKELLSSKGMVILNKDSSFMACLDRDLSSGGQGQSKHFYDLIYIGEGSDTSDKTKAEGWKFHISLCDVKVGWNVLKNVLVAHKVQSSKVVVHGVQMTGVQSGKEVTIYAWYNDEKSPKDWQKVLAEITVRLVEAKVPPGERAKSSGDKTELFFKDNRYLTYRYQHESEGKKFSQKILKLPKNPYNELDLSEKKCFELVDKEVESSVKLEK